MGDSTIKRTNIIEVIEFMNNLLDYQRSGDIDVN